MKAGWEGIFENSQEAICFCDSRICFCDVIQGSGEAG